MLDRTFGVEIECGFGSGRYNDGCSCECTCETCDYCQNGCTESLGEGETCECECDCYECSLCRYGCEGECGDSQCEEAASLLSRNGFDDWIDDIHPDGSGVEIPSPILRGREGLNELRRVMQLLNANGFYTSDADGLHVHHGAEEWVEDTSLVAHTIELWEENLPMIGRMVSDIRIGSSMCESYAGGYYSRESWARFKESKNPDELASKFKALNIIPLARQGTLEFRLHQGTLDFEKAAAWIRFGQDFMEFAKRTYKRGEIVTCATATDLLKQARTSPASRRTLLLKAAA